MPGRGRLSSGRVGAFPPCLTALPAPHHGNNVQSQRCPTSVAVPPPHPRHGGAPRGRDVSVRCLRTALHVPNGSARRRPPRWVRPSVKEAEFGRRSFGSQSRRVWGRLKLENVRFGRAEFGERRMPEVPKLGMPNGRKAGCGERGFSESTEVGPRPPSLPSGFHLEEAEFGAPAGKGMEGRNGRSRRAEDGTRRPPTTRGHRCPRSRGAAPTHRLGTLRLSARIWAVPTALRPRMRASEPIPVPQPDRGRPRQRWDAELGGRSPPPSRSPAGGGADGSGTRSWGSQPGGGARRFAFLWGGVSPMPAVPPPPALRCAALRPAPLLPWSGAHRRLRPPLFSPLLSLLFLLGYFFSSLFPSFPPFSTRELPALCPAAAVGRSELRGSRRPQRPQRRSAPRNPLLLF